MSHVHDCPTEGCNGYWECCLDECNEEQASKCHGCLRAEVARLRADLSEIETTNAALQSSFDDPSGGPMARAIARSALHLEQQQQRKLHLALRQVLEALGNGSGATEGASVELLCLVPDEVRQVVADLRASLADAEAKAVNSRGEMIAALAEEKAAVEAADRLTKERDEARAEVERLQAKLVDIGKGMKQ